MRFKFDFAVCSSLLTLVCLMPCQSLEAGELLRNGGFETLGGDNTPEGWTLYKSGATRIGVDEAGLESKRALLIESKDIQQAEDFIMQTSPTETNIPRGSTLRISAWYRTENVFFGENGSIFIRVLFADHDQLGNLAINDDKNVLRLEPSAKWKYVEKYLPVDSALRKFDYRVGLTHGKGKVWFDRLSLQLLDARHKLTLFSLKTPAPLVDGKLNDECWTGAQVAMGFLPLGKIEPANPDTEVMSCYDDEYVYLAVKCHHDKTNALLTANDRLEIYIDPSGAGKSYYYFTVDRDGKCHARVITGNEADSETMVDVLTACGQRNDYWALEMRIPFAELGCAKPADNQWWGFNVVRYVKGGEESSWASVGFPYSQRALFGKLAFYSGYEIAAEAFAWQNTERDPLMMRKTVSGLEIARELAGKTEQVNEPDLWTYFPYQASLVSDMPAKPFLGGLTPEMQAEIPAVYDAAMGINRLMVRKTFLDEKISFAKRADYYRYAIAHGKNSDQPESEPLLSAIERDSAGADQELNAAYQTYGRAFGRNRAQAGKNVEKLAGMKKQLADLEARLADLDARVGSFLKRASNDLKTAMPWKSAALDLAPGDKCLNDDGASRRFSFALYDEYYRIIGPSKYRLEEAYNSLLGPFESYVLGSGIHESPELGKAGELTFARYWALVDDRKKTGIIQKAFVPVSFGSGAFVSDVVSTQLLEKAKTDKDILLMSQDGHVNANGWGPSLNINNPEALDYIRGYLNAMGRQISAMVDTHFFLTTQEGNYDLFVYIGDKPEKRSMGYNPSNIKAFQQYLEERYGAIKTLNRKWRSDYASFAAVTPPDDKYIHPPKAASGLTYEFNRWQRVNFARFLGKVRTFLREGAPGVPVMADPSSFLANMNGYIAYKEHIADIESFHLNPSREEAMWVYMNTMNRAFGRLTGYNENYWGMYRRTYLNDERLAKREMSKFFFTLFMRDVRVSCWWPWNDKDDLGYCIYYNCGLCRLHYDQTILKWSTTALPEMFTRGRRIEKALIDSRQEIPKTAIVQPCSSAFTLESLGRTEATSPVFNHMFDIHNRLLRPMNLPHDYIAEEMVLDAKAKLSDYTLLFIPYGPYMSEEFSGMLKDWVKKGGTLIAIGPFSLQNEYGFKMDPRYSLFKTLFPDCRKVGDGDWDYTIDGGAKTPEPRVTIKPHGRGKVVYLNNALDVFLRNEALRAQLDGVLKASGNWTAMTAHPELKLLVREGGGGERYLCLCNQNVEWPVETEITVKGKYPRPFDILIPGWFPVPAEIRDGQTILKIKLEPGEWTVILLNPDN